MNPPDPKPPVVPTPGPFGSWECGCTLVKFHTWLDIEHCPLHGTAPELLAVGIVARRFLGSLNGRVSEEVWRDAYETVSALDSALAKAGVK